MIDADRTTYREATLEDLRAFRNPRRQFRARIFPNHRAYVYRVGDEVEVGRHTLVFLWRVRRDGREFRRQLVLPDWVEIEES